MRKILLAGFFFFANCYCVLYAQNKTLGVGTPVPNPNAALHVESPTGNQGFIMPRLTTAQRLATGFTSALNASDNGLMVYDTDMNTLFIWNGFSWQNTGEVAGGVKLTYPYKDSVTVATGTSDLFALKYNNPEGKRLMRIENQSATNGSSALSVYTNGTGLGAYIQAANPASTSSALYATTNSDAGGDLAPVAIYGESTGTGSLGGSFRNTNAQNNFAALYAETMGTGPAMMAVTSTGFSAIQGEASGGVSNGVSGISSSPDAGSFAVLGSNSGGGPAGVFNITNNTNTSIGLESWTNGVGGAAKFSITNANSSANAMLIESNGTGALAFLRRTNTGASMPALYVDAQSGGGIRADINGPTGYAGVFQNVNVDNTMPALYAETIGTGVSIWALKSTDATGGDAFKAENTIGTGSAGIFDVTDANNGSHTISSHTAGFGSAGFFNQTNTEAWTPALMTQTAGQGAAFSAKSLATSTNANAAEFVVEGAQNQRNAVMAHTMGTGSAGNFMISNSGSGAAALYSTTDGTGAAMQATTSTGFTAIYGRHEGPSNGNAGLFDITDASNTYPALQANTAGTGAAINARHTGPSGDALYAEYAGTGDGSAGNFRISNSNNNASAVNAATNGTGPAISSSHDANGVAFAIWSGGVKVTTNEVTTTSIDTRAAAYIIKSGGTAFNFTFGPQDGEVFMVYNETGTQITVAGEVIPLNEGRTFIVFPGGQIRSF